MLWYNVAGDGYFGYMGNSTLFYGS